MGAVRLITGLLDTQVVLWTLAADERLRAWLGAAIDRDPTAFGVSDVCLWEIAIKRSTGKLRVPDDLPQVVAEVGFRKCRSRAGRSGPRGSCRSITAIRLTAFWWLKRGISGLRS
jgi:hypothetical protein